jgi:cell division protein FtsB
MTSVDMQQINLYLPELRPQRQLISALRLLKALALICLLMILQALWTGWQHSTLSADLAVVQDQLNTQAARTQQIEANVATRATDQALVREMNTRETQLAQARELYEFMRGTNLGNMNGYSEHLKDLSRASFTGLWLTEFTIQGNGERVYLKGNAQQAAMMPDYVSRLSMGESSIRSQRFSRLVSTRAIVGGGELYEFVLETN